MMKISVTAALLLLLGGAAGAATIETPPMHYGGGDIKCLVVNNSDNDLSGTLTFYDQAGVLLYTYGLNVAAHRVNGLGLMAVTAGTQGFCRLQGSFSKKKVKMTLCANVGSLQCARAVHSD